MTFLNQNYALSESNKTINIREVRLRIASRKKNISLGPSYKRVPNIMKIVEKLLQTFSHAQESLLSFVSPV